MVSIVACGLFEPLGAVSLLSANSDTAPSAITTMTGSSDLRTISPARLGLAGASVAIALADSRFGVIDAGLFAADSAGASAAGREIELELLQDRGTRGDGVQLVRPPMLVVGGAHMPEQLGVRGIEAADGVEEGSRSRDLPGLRKVHDALGGVDAVADEIGPRFEVGRFLDRSQMKAGAQAIRREARLARSPSEILRDRQRHVERVLGTGGKRDQCAVAGVLDPVVDVREGCEIPAENRRQRGLGSVLLGRRSLRVSDKVGEEEARDERAARRMPLGFGHGEFTNGTCGTG